MFFFFFFQAEDGIRDYKVTGVQTCALPIWFEVSLAIARETSNRYQEAWALFNRGQMAKRRERRDEARSEERRVGEEGRSRGGPDHLKKKKKKKRRDVKREKKIRKERLIQSN